MIPTSHVIECVLSEVQRLDIGGFRRASVLLRFSGDNVTLSPVVTVFSLHFNQLPTLNSFPPPPSLPPSLWGLCYRQPNNFWRETARLVSQGRPYITLLIALFSDGWALKSAKHGFEAFYFEVLNVRK